MQAGGSGSIHLPVPKREGGDEPLRKRLRELAGERRRFGYRRLSILLAREGLGANHKKLYRLYTEERLAVKRRRGRKRAMGTRRPMLLPAQVNERWSLDFVSDALTDSRRFRTLCVVDDFTREALAVVADVSLSCVRVARELDRLIEQRGKPKMIVSDIADRIRPIAIASGEADCGVGHLCGVREDVSNAIAEFVDGKHQSSFAMSKGEVVLPPT